MSNEDCHQSQSCPCFAVCYKIKGQQLLKTSEWETFNFLKLITVNLHLILLNQHSEHVPNPQLLSFFVGIITVSEVNEHSIIVQ
jgi:hypothetical protein